MPRDPSCEGCLLHAAAQNVCIWGERRGTHMVGDKPRVMIVGQGPGPEENVTGRPFIGPSGGILEEGVTYGGVSDYYVTNLTKCDPYPYKEPPKEAIAACSHYLEEEIAAIQPDYILAIGALSMRYFLGPGKITELAGKEFWSEKHHAKIIPVIHPAHILRSGKGKEPWMATMARTGAMIRGNVPTTPPVKVYHVTDAADLRDFVQYVQKTKQGFTFDFETKPKSSRDPKDPKYDGKLGLHWWHQDFKAYSIAFSFNGTEAWSIPLDHPESPFPEYIQHWFYAQMREVMQDPTRPKSPHNMLFDDLVWRRVSGYQPYTTCDTAVLVHTLHEDEPVRLKWQVPVKFGWPDWDIDATREHPLALLLQYMGYDAAGTYLLKDHLLAELAQDYPLQQYFSRFVMRYMRALERLIWNGVPVNERRAHELIADCKRRIKIADAQIPVENPASSDQIREWFYASKEEGGLGYPVYKLTEGGKPAADEESINWLALQGYPEAKVVLDARRPRKQDSTYLVPPLVEIAASIDHRRHFEYNGARVETGRLSSAYHVIPRINDKPGEENYVREIYDAPPGWVWVHNDAKQIEARLVAWYAAGEPPDWEHVDPRFATLLLAFRDGRDPYRETAAAALRKEVKDVTPDERQRMGKVPTLAMLYEISAMGFQQYAWSEFEIIYTDAEARHLHRTFYQLWPEIQMWHQHVKRMIGVKGWIRSPIGRLRRLPEAMSGDRKIAGDAQREGINAGPQGLASDILQEALILADEWLNPDEIQIVGDCHDALDFLVRDEPHILVPFLEHVGELLPTAVRALRPFGLQIPEGLLQSEVLVGGLAATKTAEEYLKELSAAVAPQLANA